MRVEDMQFSVLMSVYKNEKAEWFKGAVESVIQQSVLPTEIVIVEDGPLTKELYGVCEELKKKYQNLIRFRPLKENMGLGYSLRYGVKECKYPLVARMDTDDIANQNRFAIQLRRFQDDPKLSICGGWIDEFETDSNKIASVRKVPETQHEIYEFAKRRNPFNHMTVMFKKEDVLMVGNYQEFHLLEDYYLWFRLIIAQYKTVNIQESLVKVRIGNNMIKKRGGINYFMNEFKLYTEFYRKNYINKSELISILLLRFVARICPNNVRSILYKNLLRA